MSNIQDDISKLKAISFEKEEIQKKQEANVGAKKIKELDEKINKVERDIKTKVSDLPFGTSGFSTPTLLTGIPTLSNDLLANLGKNLLSPDESLSFLTNQYSFDTMKTNDKG